MNTLDDERDSDDININLQRVALNDVMEETFGESVLVQEVGSANSSKLPTHLPPDILKRFDNVENSLQSRDPHTAISLLAQLTIKLEGLADTDYFDMYCQRLYVYFAKAYEQLKDRKNAARYLNKAIISIEKTLSKENIRDGEIDCFGNTLALLADLRKRYALSLEHDNIDPPETAVAWLKAAKSFDKCHSSRDAAFSALRAVRWFITSVEPKPALKTLTWALKLTEQVDVKSDQGRYVVY